MKKLLVLLFLGTSLVSFSQEYLKDGSSVKPESTPGLFTIRHVNKMIILNQCRKVDDNNKSELKECTSNELTKHFSNELLEFKNNDEISNIESGTMKIQFVFGENAEIRDFKVLYSTHKELYDFMVKAFEKLKKDIKFEPAQIDGEKVDLQFQLPIKYDLNQE